MSQQLKKIKDTNADSARDIQKIKKELFELKKQHTNQIDLLKKSF